MKLAIPDVRNLKTVINETGTSPLPVSVQLSRRCLDSISSEALHRLRGEAIRQADALGVIPDLDDLVVFDYSIILLRVIRQHGFECHQASRQLPASYGPHIWIVRERGLKNSFFDLFKFRKRTKV